jgi:hypothetical protein
LTSTAFLYAASLRGLAGGHVRCPQCGVALDLLRIGGNGLLKFLNGILPVVRKDVLLSQNGVRAGIVGLDFESLLCRRLGFVILVARQQHACQFQLGVRILWLQVHRFG